MFLFSFYGYYLINICCCCYCIHPYPVYATASASWLLALLSTVPDPYYFHYFLQWLFL